MLEAIGYWFNDMAPSAYPRPQKLVGSWDPDECAAVIAYLRAGDVLETYRGASFCRFDCGEQNMGHRDFTDGRFAWPEGLAHYVEQHKVTLPRHFVTHALSGAPKTEPQGRRIDDAPWFAWGKRQGATIALDAWDGLSWTDQRKVLERLHAQLPADHVLFEKQLEVLLGRRATEELILALPDGRIAVVCMRDLSTRVLRGWDDWS